MRMRSHNLVLHIAAWLALTVSSAGALWAQQAAQQKDSTPPDKTSQTDQDATKKPPANSALPRGKKLYLKDGTFQIIRSYERQGDTVRYYSVERSAWEEIPESLVDWDATAKAAAEEARQQEEFAAKIKTREINQSAVEVLDVDASLEISPGLILPQDKGMFAVAGKTITLLKENVSVLKTDKGREAERIATGVPLIPSRHTLQLKGKSAAIRLPAGPLEFYYRIGEDDPEPELVLVRVQQKGDMRVVESITTDIIQENSEKRKNIPMLRWQIAKGVYRLTVSQTMDAGEYALAIVEPDQEDGLDNSMISNVVWDFGMDGAAPAAAKKK